MKKAVRKAWIEALRSGKYPQGKFRLKSENGGYCCLGVLCQLAIDSGEVDPRTVHWAEGVPPKSVRVWAGLTKPRQVSSSDSRVPRSLDWVTDREHLPSLNDGEGATFKQIATIIARGK